ncbi:MAG: BON domain-containing protein [Dysgonamonadaceae bacterium]|jgi:osmotically-inducible protein OsmY|nr:BON domain-containing protein [Dysgonamonadaceae bacterium]
MKTLRFLSVFVLSMALVAGVFSSCKKVSDADLKTAVETVLATSGDYSAVVVDVKDKVATLSGVVSSEEVKTALDAALKSVKGLKSIESLIEIAPPAPDFTAIDAALQTGLAAALKDHQKVIASVKDGIVTLKGEIKKADLATLMQKISALSPVQILNDSLTVK